MKIISLCAFAGLAALAGCGHQNTALEQGALTTGAAALSTYETTGSASETALTAAEGALAVYRNTPNPSQIVLTKAQSLLDAANSAVAAAKANPTDALKAAESSAITSLTLYLLTAAPGNGVTPATS